MRRHGKVVAPTTPNMEVMWIMDPESIEAVTKTCWAWLDQANRMRDEAIRFTQERFTKEFDAVMRLAGCTNPTEALAVQAEFADNMAADYFAEGQRIVELMDQMAKAISRQPKSERTHH